MGTDAVLVICLRKLTTVFGDTVAVIALDILGFPPCEFF